MNRTPRTAQSVAAQPLAGLTVLVVDDHYDTVQMLVEYLLSVGAIVLGLRSARAAMGFAKTVRFDAVLIDLRMPGEDGRWFLRELGASRPCRPGRRSSRSVANARMNRIGVTASPATS